MASNFLSEVDGAGLRIVNQFARRALCNHDAAAQNVAAIIDF